MKQQKREKLYLPDGIMEFACKLLSEAKIMKRSRFDKDILCELKQSIPVEELDKMMDFGRRHRTYGQNLVDHVKACLTKQQRVIPLNLYGEPLLVWFPRLGHVNDTGLIDYLVAYKAINQLNVFMHDLTLPL